MTNTMNVIEKLIKLVDQLYQETEGYDQNPSDVQLWYNRGYANGVTTLLIAQGYGDKLKQLNLDAEGLYHDEQVMEWHKAYHHGFEMGSNEAKDVIPGGDADKTH